MRPQYTTKQQIGGITEENRRLLDKLHRETTCPFTVSIATKVLGINQHSTARLLAYWASRGWLSRIRRGLYITVPLGAQHPSERREDPWIVVATLFEPAYIGGWSACEHWGLTEQIFSEIAVFTARRVRTRKQRVQDTKFVLRVVPKERLFGTVNVWRQQTRIQVSDPSRTLADILSEPAIGGGIRHVAQVVKEYFSGEHRDDDKLVNYISRLKNRTICKRLGYLLENFQIDAPKILRYCEANVSAGYSKLDPTVKVKGKLSRRWNLDINVDIGSETGRV